MFLNIVFIDFWFFQLKVIMSISFIFQISFLFSSLFFSWFSCTFAEATINIYNC